MKKKFQTEHGFTLIEILVAMMIISVGYLAFSQMGFLSLRLKQMAERGTDATQVIQFITDRDLAQVKRVHLLNTKTYQDGITVLSLDFSYCSGGTNSVCGQCPCDPLEVLTTDADPAGGSGVVTTCSVVDIEDLNPLLLNFTDEATCQSNLSALLSIGNELMVVVRQASTEVTTTSVPNTVSIDMTYAAKSPQQFKETGNSITLRDSLGREFLTVTAHEANYADDVVILSGWTDVRIPHVP